MCFPYWSVIPFVGLLISIGVLPVAAPQWWTLNGPNFMVKTIAEHHGIRMPSFGGYMLYSCSILIPLFMIETVVFFR